MAYRPPRPSRFSLKILEFRHESLLCKRSYENLGSYKAALVVIRVVKGIPSRFGDLKDQIERASLSIGSNIAEGCAKLQASEKNGKHLFASAKGSCWETRSFIRKSLILFASEVSKEDRELFEFAMKILELIGAELSHLIDHPRLSLSPGEIRIFEPAERTFLEHILTMINEGKNIRLPLLSHINAPAQEIFAKKPQPRYQCSECHDLFPSSAGRKFKIPASNRFLAKSITIYSSFVCNGCLAKRSSERPQKISDGILQWKPRTERKKELKPTPAVLSS